MAMSTGENELGLKKIIDMMRMISIIVLLMHCYYYFYAAFDEWHLTSKISEQLIKNIIKTGLFDSFHRSKFIALGFLLLSMIGAKGRKSEKLNYRTAFAWLLSGLILYFISWFVIYISSIDTTTVAVIYMSITDRK